MILIYLIGLIIAPQLWWEPMLNMPIDIFIYLTWIVMIAFTGRLPAFLKFNVQDYFFLAWLFWITVSMHINFKHDLSNTQLIYYIKMFVLYRLTYASIANDKDLATVIRSLIVVVFVIVVEAIQHKYYSPDLTGWAGQSLGWVDPAVIAAGGTGRTKWVGIFDGPGVFCVMFTLILPFILVRLDKQFSLTKKAVALALMAPLLLAIWTTGARGGMLASASIFACYFLIRMRVSMFTIIKVGALLGLLFALAPAHLTQTKDSTKSAQNRVAMWAAGLDMVENDPFIGVGKGNFMRYSNKLIAHNSFIENMSETGLIGVFFWLSLLYFSVKALYLYSKQVTDPVHRSNVTGVGLSLVGYMVSSFFVTLEYETLYFMLALTRAICGYANIDLAPNKQDFYIIVGGTVGLYLMVKIFVAYLYF